MLTACWTWLSVLASGRKWLGWCSCGIWIYLRETKNHLLKNSKVYHILRQVSTATKQIGSRTIPLHILPFKELRRAFTTNSRAFYFEDTNVISSTGFLSVDIPNDPASASVADFTVPNNQQSFGSLIIPHDLSSWNTHSGAQNLLGLRKNVHRLGDIDL